MKGDGTDYDDNDWNHISGRFVKVEDLPVFPGSFMGGEEYHSTGGGRINPYNYKLKDKTNWATKPKEFFEKGADQPISKAFEATEKGVDGYSNKAPTSKDIYARVKYWSSYPSSSGTLTAHFDTEKQMKEQFPGAEWNDKYLKWEIGMNSPINFEKAMKLDIR